MSLDIEQLMDKPKEFLHLLAQGKYQEVYDSFEISTLNENNYVFLVESLAGIGDFNKLYDYLKILQDKNLITNRLALAFWHDCLSRYHLHSSGLYDKAFKSAFKGLEILDELGDCEWLLTKEIITGLLNATIGELHRYQGDFNKALLYLNESRNIFEENQLDYYLTNAIHQLGLVYGLKGDLDKGKELLEESLLIREENYNNPLLVGLSLNALGVIDYFKGNLSEAEDYFINALDLVLQTKNPNTLSVIYGNLGIIESSRGNITKALEYHNICIEYQKDIGNPSWLGHAYFSISQLHIYHADLDLATEAINKSKTYYEKINKINGLADIFVIESNILVMKGLYEKAIEKLEEALNIQFEIGDPLIISNSLTNLARILKITNHSIKEEVLPRYPLPPFKSKLIENNKKIIDAHIAYQEQNFGISKSIWDQLLRENDMIFEIKQQCFQALIEISLVEWERSKDNKSFQAILMYLNKFETIALKENMFTNLLQVYLTRSKIAQINMEIKNALNWVNKAIVIASDRNLHKHLSMAEKEKDKIKKIQFQMKNELISSLAEESNKNQETIKEYFENFTESLINNEKILKDNSIKIERKIVKTTDVLSSRQLERENQIKMICDILQDNPMGVLQKDMTEKTGLSKATVSRRINELMSKNRVVGQLEGRSRLLRLVEFT